MNPLDPAPSEAVIPAEELARRRLDLPPRYSSLEPRPATLRPWCSRLPAQLRACVFPNRLYSDVLSEGTVRVSVTALMGRIND